MLVEHVMDQFRSQKCELVTSGVRIKNREAQKFWKKRGFEIDPESEANCSIKKELVPD